MTLTFEYENIRFTCSPMGARPGQHVVNATRISDGRDLHGTIRQAFINESVIPAGRTLQEHFELACQARMLEALGNFEPKPTLCYGCEKPLDARDDTDYQFDNVLWVQFHGGYGMFIDEMPVGPGDKPGPYDPREPYRVVICHECAHTLCDTVPWAAKLLEPLRSHSHTITDYPRLLAEGHRGWDLDKHREEHP